MSMVGVLILMVAFRSTMILLPQFNFRTSYHCYRVVVVVVLRWIRFDGVIGIEQHRYRKQPNANKKGNDESSTSIMMRKKTRSSGIATLVEFRFLN